MAVLLNVFIVLIESRTQSRRRAGLGADTADTRRPPGTRGPYLIYHSIVAERRPTPTG